MITSLQNHEAKRQADPRLEAFEQLERDGASPSWVYPIRKAGIARFAELGFPSTSDEDWRFTNVAPVAALPFAPALTAPRTPGNVDLSHFPLTGLANNRLVFIDGHYCEELSSIQPQPAGVELSSLSAALAKGSSPLESQLAKHVRGDQDAFAALNTAFFTDGAFIFVPDGVSVSGPVQLLFLSTAMESGRTSHPRNLIMAGKGSQLTVFETYGALASGAYVTNAVTELVADEGAKVEHCKFQDEAHAAFHISSLHLQLKSSSNVWSHSIALGGRLSRTNIRTVLDGPHLECVLNGLYLLRGDQLADHHMIVDHAMPHCNSHEYFNGILDDRAKAVFHGRILVRQDAQKTDAKQTNKNLLLTDDATVDTKPQLEIYADDVKCTHGATIGQLDEESIFYLRARGIAHETARRMLVHAFAEEIIERIQHEAFRDELNQLVWTRLDENPSLSCES